MPSSRTAAFGLIQFPSFTTPTFELIQMPSFSTAAIELIQKPSFRTAAIGSLSFCSRAFFPNSPPSAFFSPFSPSAPVALSGPIAVSCAELFLPGGRPPSRPPTQVKLFLDVLICYLEFVLFIYLVAWLCGCLDVWMRLTLFVFIGKIFEEGSSICYCD